MMRSRTVWVLVVCLFTTGPLLSSGSARAANEEQARVYLDKATAAYALNHYAVAAENFEKAFELKPDPALLYNAAQAYRLAGNKERALELYESYLRVYGGTDKRAQVEARIKDLKQAIEHDKKVATSPPNNTLPVNAGSSGSSSRSVEPPPVAPPPVAPSPVAPPPVTTPPAMPPPVASTPPSAPTTLALSTPPPAASDSSSPNLLTKSAAPPADENDSVFRKTWFWVAVGGGVAAAAVVAVLLASGGSNAASPTLGRAKGN